MAKIRDVETRSGNRLLVELDSGSVIYVNLTNKLDTVRFHDLRNESIFNNVVTDGYALYWDFGRISISLSELYDLTKANNQKQSASKDS